MQTLNLVLQVLLALWEVFKMYAQGKLTREATEQMLGDLKQMSDKMIADAQLAAASVDESDDAIENDPNNRP